MCTNESTDQKKAPERVDPEKLITELHRIQNLKQDLQKQLMIKDHSNEILQQGFDTQVIYELHNKKMAQQNIDDLKKKKEQHKLQKQIYTQITQPKINNLQIRIEQLELQIQQITKLPITKHIEPLPEITELHKKSNQSVQYSITDAWDYREDTFRLRDGDDWDYYDYSVFWAFNLKEKNLLGWYLMDADDEKLFIANITGIIPPPLSESKSKASSK